MTWRKVEIERLIFSMACCAVVIGFCVIVTDGRFRALESRIEQMEENQMDAIKYLGAELNPAYDESASKVRTLWLPEGAEPLEVRR